ncbi:ATP-binding protein [Streptomyces sp. NPDC057336]|uniref:ATP-binding protein n=1 Tax=Streptomyces sp. NPDC057336 TaxID=3346102 RepID=UPI0036369614
MSDGTGRVRLLPGAGGYGRPALLITDGDGPVSRIADHMEAVQLGLGERLLGRARELLEGPRPGGRELRSLAGQLADALADALSIAGARGGCPCGGRPVDGASPTPTAYGRLDLPGRDLASARVARHYVRDTCRSWGLSSDVTDDLVVIAGELVANALEHSDSRTVTIACARTAEAVTVGVTDSGRSGGAPWATAAGAECERGRGLLITDALAARWGTRRTGRGLSVWAEVAVGPAADVSVGAG